ncbi:MAG: hypothetical protein ABI402_11540 [Ferruginibacter sp.]
MKQILILVVIIFSTLLSCNNPVKTGMKNNTLKENRIHEDSVIAKVDSLYVPGKEDYIFDKIIKIPEIVAFKNLLEKKNRNLKMWICDTIQKNSKNYIMYNVGEDNGFALVAEYHFAREIKNSNLLAYDAIDDTILTLEAWRRKRK